MEWVSVSLHHFTGNKNGSKLYGSEQMRQNGKDISVEKSFVKRALTQKTYEICVKCVKTLKSSNASILASEGDDNQLMSILTITTSAQNVALQLYQIKSA